MTRTSNSLAAYPDVRAALDTILAAPSQSAELRFPSHSEAARWRQRANKLRALMRDQSEKVGNLFPGEGTSPYDIFVFSIKPGSSVVEVRPHILQAELIIDGQVVNPGTAADEAADLLAILQKKGN